MRTSYMAKGLTLLHQSCAGSSMGDLGSNRKPRLNAQLHIDSRRVQAIEGAGAKDKRAAKGYG